MAYIDTNSGQYPLSEREIRAAFPNTSFPQPFVPPTGYAVVFNTPKPTYDAVTQAVREIAPVLSTKGQWEQAWEVYEMYATQGEKDAAIAQAASDLRTARLADVDLVAKGKRDAVVADISPAEMASWPIKRSEALAYQTSGLAADAPNLAREATARQITLADLVAKVLNKADQLAALEADIAGHCGYLQDQIRAASDQAAIEAIDINAGWPV